MSVLGLVLILGQLAPVAAAPGEGPVLTILDRSEARLRTRLPGTGVATDLETLPVLTVTQRTLRSDVAIGYAAQLSYLDVVENPQFTVAQSVRLSGAYMLDRGLRVFTNIQGTVGKQYVEGLVTTPTLAPTPTTPVTTTTPTAFVAPIPVIDSLSYRADVGVGYKLSALWDVLGTVAWAGGEGLDTASRVAIPRYYGPSASTTLGYTATRRDRFTTNFNVAYTTSPTINSDFLSVALTEAWTRSFSVRTTGYAGAGLSFQHGDPGTNQRSTSDFYPDGELGVNYAVPVGFAESISFRLGTRLGFHYDAVLRSSSPEASGQASAIYTSPHVGASLNATAVTTLSSSVQAQAARQVGGGATVWYSPTRALRFELGARGYVQDLPGNLPTIAGAVPTNTFQWATFVALVVVPPAIEL
ncbi:MAG TPA: hypothetical protein VH062_30915 [Polyangiaceae bacterium]|jgi:hypothetical protein|nr:hypothetical protein [Polyangiaceae bacterium]